MAWRFKASKYKNAAPIVPKPEACIRDICVGSYQTYGNNICASAAFMAFNWEHVGSSMAVLPLDDCGRKSKTMPLLHAHSDTITDMEFSPFHDGLLMTGSQDSLVKIWHIPPEGLKESLSTPECTLSHKQRRVENVGFHPVADGLIHVASGHELSLWDLTTQHEAFVNRDHTEVIQSTSWKKDGRLLATSCKDKKVRVLDPRADRAALAAPSHQSIKDSRVVWLGHQDRILTTGFDAARLRQITIRDVRNLSQPQKTIELDCSTGVLMPLYDPDTNMLFLAGKGDITILYMELTDREPYLIEGLRHSGEQTKGACLVPKRAVRVMDGEVNRVLQLTSSTVVPIMYQVPRKSYREYHADLYPDTAGAATPLGARGWLAGRDAPVPRVSLRPGATGCAQVHRGDLRAVVTSLATMTPPKKAEQAASPAPLIVEAKCQPKQPVDERADSDRIDFINVKDMIKGMEKKKPPEAKPTEARETNGFGHRRATDNGHAAADETPIAPDLVVTAHRCEEATENPGEEATENSAEEATKNPGEVVAESRDEKDCEELERGLVNGASVQPPKPLPRSSISEGSEESPGVPKPKPRTTAAPPPGYKPRLGPKPFSASQGSEEFSFDKVFSVPSVPGGKSETASPASPASPPRSSPPRLADDKDKSLSPTSDADNTPKDEYTNGKSDTSLEEDAPSSDSGYRPRSPAAPRTAETTDGAQSIADRRRAYESRSASVAADAAAPPSPAPLRRRDSLKSRKSPEREDKRASVPTVTKRTSTVFGKVSKFRHLKGTPGHKSTHIENIKNVSRQISGECNGFYANSKRCALPVTGGAGRVAVLELPPAAPAAPAAGPPALLLPSAVQDWAFDPFNDARIVTACDDGSVAEWIVPDDGLKESTNTPLRSFAAHPDKIHLIRFHPTASDLLTTVGHDCQVKIWDLEEDPPRAAITLTGHTDQIYAMEWSPYGEMLATLCKDGLIRIFKPRQSPEAVASGAGPASSRGGRVAWALHDTYLVVTGFDKVSERQILLYKASDLSAPVASVGLDVSPAILMMHLDHDSNTLFLTGRGDQTIYCYEVTGAAPHLCPLSHHRAATLHQGLAFLHKNTVAVEKVEFARALRLTNGTVEPLSFSVPRIKTELFQDDLFPATLVSWRAWQRGAAWLAGARAPPLTACLRPPGMAALSSVATPTPQIKEMKEKEKEKEKEKDRPLKPRPDIVKAHEPRDPRDKQDSILKSISAKVQMNLKLEQDNMEGVDDAEWDQ